MVSHREVILRAAHLLLEFDEGEALRQSLVVGRHANILNRSVRLEQLAQVDVLDRLGEVGNVQLAAVGVGIGPVLLARRVGDEDGKRVAGLEFCAVQFESGLSMSLQQLKSARASKRKKRARPTGLANWT